MDATYYSGNILLQSKPAVNGEHSWFRHSQTPAWTIVTHYLRTAVWLCVRDCSESRTVRHVWSVHNHLVATRHLC